MSIRVSIFSGLAQTRKQASLTQEDLALRAGVSRMTVQRLEAGELDPRLSTVHEMAHALGLEMVLLPRHLHGPFEEFLRAATQPGANADAPLPSVVDLLAPHPRSR